LALSFNSILFFLTEAAQYECSYRRTPHHATATSSLLDRRRARGFYTAVQAVQVRGSTRWLGLRAGTADIKARRRPRKLGR